MNWGTADTVDWLSVYLNNNSNWTDVPNNSKISTTNSNATGGSFIYYGEHSGDHAYPAQSTLKPGTKYNLKLKVRRKDSQLTTTSANIEFTTKSIAKISNLKDGFSLAIGDKLSLQFNDYSSSKSKLILYIQKDNSSDFEKVAETDEVIQQESYAWDLSSVTSILYSKLSTRNSANIRIVCTTTISENDQTITYTANDIKGKINVSDSNPTFTTFTYGDENTTTQNVLGDKTYMPQGMGNMVVRISTANKAVAKNGASIIKYVLNVSGASSLSMEKSYSSSAEVSFTLGSFGNVGEHKISIYAVDSRGNVSGTVSSTFKVLQYIYPQFNLLSFGRLYDYEAETVLDFVGTYSRLVIGTEDKNTDVVFKYRYCKSSESYPSTYTTINGVSTSNSTNTLKKLTFSQNTDDNTFGITGVGSSQKLLLDNNDSFKFEFVITDKLISVSTEVYVEKGIPIMFTGENGQVSIGMIPDIDRNEKLQVSGDIMVTDSNGNKTGILERMDKMIVINENEQEQQVNGLWFRIVG